MGNWINLKNYYCVPIVIFLVWSYQLFQVTPKDKASFDALIQLFENTVEYDFWTEPRGLNQPMDIMVPPAKIEAFVALMHAFRMEYRVKIIDMQRYESISSRYN